MFPKRVLKRWYVYPDFQNRLIGFNLLVVCSVLAAVFVEHTLHNEKLYLLGKVAELAPEHPFFALQEAYEKKWNFVFLSFSFVLSLLSVAVSLWLSHKLVGPLHRMKVFLKQCHENPTKVRPIKFRKGDHLHEIADLLNRVLFK
jgi:heme/copper-type cytochrome/quinol oxidase subunit 4